VLEYLIEEVLQRQTAEVQEFLLRTSILDRLCGALCEAVAERTDSTTLLRALAKPTCFSFPTIDTRGTAIISLPICCVLLATTAPHAVRLPHRRASIWFDQQQLGAEAVNTLAAATLSEWPTDQRYRAAIAAK
jgi:LuxR family maltose regulon positive regulatory protein